MIGVYDYCVIGFYFVFMLVIGIVFRKYNSDTSDYFRGGGSMLWWLSGASSFMVIFSAWTFTGAAGKIYDTGTMALVLFFANAIASVFVYFFTCYRFRQMRVITYVEAVQRRFGRFNQQLYVWMQVVMGLLMGSIAMNAIGVFIASVFGLSMELTILVVGVVVVFMSVAGGAWAVVASDFVQMLIIVGITMVAAFLTLRLPEVGGITGLIEQVPAAHFDWTQLRRGPILVLWIIAIVVSQFLVLNSLNNGAARFLTVKDGNHARRAAVITIVGMLVGPVIWLIPAMASRIVCGDLAAQFPDLSQPNEAAYVAICMKVMPRGLIGLLACGIFAATMSSMDSALNMNSGVFIRNFYSRIIRPKANELELLLMGKIFTVVFGAIIIIGGLYTSKVRTLGLFELVLVVGSLIGFPMVIPMFLGIFIKKTPPWSAWSTVLVGLIAAWTIKLFFDPSLITRLMGWSEPLSSGEKLDASWAITVIAVTVTSSVWFCITTLFYEDSDADYKKQVDDFFTDVNTPIDHVKENIKTNDERQYRVLGLLCIIYGFFTLLFMLIPNDFSGRLCFAFCAAIPLVIGFLLRRKASNINKVKEAAAYSDVGRIEEAEVSGI
jgi:SSS family transporter